MDSTEKQPLCPRDLFRMTWREGAALFCILLVAFLIRFAAQDPSIGVHGGDGSSNYLVADHVLRYGEFPLTGPYNAFLPLIGNSPFYYYFITAMALFDNSPDNVATVFTVLNCISLLCLFFAGREFFGRGAAFIAILLLTFSPIYISDSGSSIWQPYIMEIVLTVSLLLFAIGYKSKNLLYLGLSQAVFMAAIASHMSAAFLLPVFGVCLYRVVFSIGGKKQIYRFVASAAVMFFLLYGSSIAVSIYKAHQPNYGTPDIEHNTSLSIPSEQSVRVFLYSMVLRVFYPMNSPIVLSVIAIFSIVYLYVPFISETRKYYFRVLLASVAVVLLINLVILWFRDETILRYFTAAGWALALITGSILYEFFLRWKWLRLLGVGIILAVIYVFISHPVVQSAVLNIPHLDRPNRVIRDDSIDAVIKEIEHIKKEKGFEKYNFFDFYGLRVGDHYTVPHIFLQPIEKRLGIQLQKLTLSGYVGLNTSEYMFLSCLKKIQLESLYSDEQCLITFKKNQPTYSVLKEVYGHSTFSVFIAKKDTSI